MRIPAALTFFIDDCHISATIVADQNRSIFTSDKKSKRDVTDRENATVTLLKELSKDVRDWSLKPEFRGYEITGCQVVLSPSWYISQTSVVSKESPKPIIFTETTIIESAGENLAANPDIFTASKDLILIEKEISHVSLNGYPVANITKQRATLCKASVYYCYMNKRFNNIIRDAIQTIPLSNSNISFRSLAKLTADHSKQLLIKADNLAILKNGNTIIINFCSYLTEIIYLHSEANLNIISLPIGYKDTLHSINDHLASEHVATESLLDLFIDNKLKPESRDLVLELLHRLGMDWVSTVMQGIAQLPKSPGTSTKLFVYGIDKRQTEIAHIFTRLLPFHSEEEVPLTLFSDIML